MPQSVIHEILYMKHPTRLKILQGVFLCSNLVVQMDPDPVHQAQVVTQDLHPVRSDGAEPYRAVYREAESAGAAHLRHREVLCHPCQDPLRAICARCEAGPVQEAEEAAAVQHLYPRSPHAAQDRILLCGGMGLDPQDSPAP